MAERPGVRTNARNRRRPAAGVDTSKLYAPLNFDRINSAALARMADLLSRWLPDGRRQGNEWVALNPRRFDAKPRSFSINMTTGRWADFATGDKGGDPISLAAYLHGLTQVEAARNLSTMLGVK